MSNKTSQSAFPIGGILLVIFITLKALNLIDWSWWWVFSPVWFAILFGILVTIGVLIVQVRKNL